MPPHRLQKSSDQSDPQSGPARELPDSLLKLVDVITPNETEAEKLTGISVSDETGAARAAQVLHDKGIGQVLIPGSRGVWLSVNGEGRRIRALKLMRWTLSQPAIPLTARMSRRCWKENRQMKRCVLPMPLPQLLSPAGAQPSVPWRREIDAFLAERG